MNEPIKFRKWRYDTNEKKETSNWLHSTHKTGKRAGSGGNIFAFMKAMSKAGI
jgi:hypothetical protein